MRFGKTEGMELSQLEEMVRRLKQTRGCPFVALPLANLSLLWSHFELLFDIGLLLHIELLLELLVASEPLVAMIYALDQDN